MNALKQSIIDQVKNECIGNELHDGPYTFYIEIDKCHTDAYQSLQDGPKSGYGGLEVIHDWIHTVFSDWVDTLDEKDDCVDIHLSYDDNDSGIDVAETSLTTLSYTVWFQMVNDDDE